MNDSGYIKLYRSLLKWEWYTDANTFRVFTHLLLTANWQDGRFKGQEVKRGQLITTINRLAEELKLSQQNVKTSLTHLKETNEILTNGIANRWTLITIVKYDFYQAKEEQANQPINQPLTNQSPTSQPTANQPLTLIEEQQEVNKKESKKTNVYERLTNEDFDYLLAHINADDHLTFMDKLLEINASVKHPRKYAEGVAKKMNLWTKEN